MTKELFVSRFSAWAPEIENSGEWNEWVLGRRELSSNSNKAPEITFTEPMFRRRLSRISKMTIQVVHDLLPFDKEKTKLFFISFRGEISKQLKINKMVIEDNSILPAAFSTSVFNAPIALASIAFGLKGGYSAVFPGNNSFSSGLAAACAEFPALEDGAENEDELVVVYADEDVPSEYSALLPTELPNKSNPAPLAFGFVLTKKQSAVSFSALKEKDSPYDFLKALFQFKECYVSA